MTLRDFSDKAYDKIKAKLQASIMEGEYDPGDLQYLEEYFQFREQHGSDSYFEHYKKLEMFGEASERLNKVFKDVQAHGGAMPASTAATKEHLSSFTSIVYSMTEMINPRCPPIR